MSNKISRCPSSRRAKQYEIYKEKRKIKNQYLRSKRELELKDFEDNFANEFLEKHPRLGRWGFGCMDKIRVGLGEKEEREQLEELARSIKAREEEAARIRNKRDKEKEKRKLEEEKRKLEEEKRLYLLRVRRRREKAMREEEKRRIVLAYLNKQMIIKEAQKQLAAERARYKRRRKKEQLELLY